VCMRVWEGERGRKRGKVERRIHRGGISSVCVIVWKGERGGKRGEVESECVRVWEREREKERQRGGVEAKYERVGEGDR
jgi:hypothetical protein